MSQKEHPTPPTEEAAHEADGTREPFLRRWSRLKADSAARPDEASVPEAVPGSGAAGQDENTQGPEDPAELPPGDEDMPPLESLDENSDFSGFMSPRVSTALRKQALRKLFRSPKFNVISELDDYIDDYRSYPALGDIVTSDMKHAAARLLEKQLAADAADAAETVEAGEAGLLAGSDTGPQDAATDSAAPTDAGGEDSAAAGDADETDDRKDDSDSEPPARDA
ncbi:MAG TPA: DUF3306 domain-containing protein [Gammaproteobacteria bacterium]|nr:DUF3306 domain-containing protein [Gammaproteobacteria bacterium]